MNFTITLAINPQPSPAAEVQAGPPPLPPGGSAHGIHMILPQPITTMELRLGVGETIVVTGPNGVGKSAFLSEAANELAMQGAPVETFFGHRQIQFQSEDIDQVGQSLENFQAQLRQNVTRFRNPWGEQHLKSVVRRITNHQAQAATDVIAAQLDGTEFTAALADHPQVITTINSVFASARLPVQILLAGGVLRAQRGAAQYGIDRLSDGERAALLIVGAVLIQPPNSFILVDEPERHLNPAISGALLSALVRTRTDLGFIFSTHDLELLEWLDPDQVIHLRDSLVITSDPERRRFDLSLLTLEEGIPEELRFAILGTRRLLLLVEGEASSEDKALYGHIYPEWNVVARGGWETVVSGVRALSGNNTYHWLRANGIIDRDGRDTSEQATLAADGIFCLPVPTVENLFLHSVVIEQMAQQVHELKGGLTGPERVDALNTAIASLLPRAKDEIIVQRLVWEGNRRLSEQKLSARSVRGGQVEIPRLDLRSIRQRLEAEFDVAIIGNNPIAMLQQIPVKKSQIPSKVAEVLGFDDFKDYARAVLKQIERSSDAGMAMVSALRGVMPVLPVAPSAPTSPAAHVPSSQP